MKNTIFLLILVCIFFVSCTESRIAVNALTSCDTCVPVLETVSMKDDRHVVLVFDEDVLPFGDTFNPYLVDANGCEITVTLPSSLEAGKSITLEARVRDIYGNSTGFSIPVWGYNKNPATLIINEITFNASSKQVRRTELYASKSGDITGICLCAGSASHYSARIIFPDLFVNSNSYILVWWCDADTFRKFFSSVELAGDILYACDELGCLNICTDSSDTVYNASNGVLCLASSPSPGAGIPDAVVWSSHKAEKYNGFGTSEIYERVNEIMEAGAWSLSEINAKYAADTSAIGNASTRSLSRKNFTDTNTKKDWYTTESGAFTPGSVNL